MMSTELSLSAPRCLPPLQEEILAVMRTRAAAQRQIAPVSLCLSFILLIFLLSLPLLLALLRSEVTAVRS